MSQFKVQFTKYFVGGSLEGIAVDGEISMATLDDAAEYVRFCHEHAERPVKPYYSSPYIFLASKIVSVENGELL